jgi:hypothetical protein
MTTSPLDYVRASTARVMDKATHVQINEPALQSLASTLLLQQQQQQQEEEEITWDAEGWHYQQDAAIAGPLTCQYILVLDSLNFCFWPHPGLEYEHLARGLRIALEKDETAFDAQKLATITPEVLNSWLDPPGTFTFPQLEERVRKVQEVGQVLLRHFDGLAVNVVKQANYSAEELVRLVTAYFPGFRDECVYKGTHVFFYKRAQIFVGDVWAAYGKNTTDTHPFGFVDMEKLTMFADYRIPQILRARGVLVYTKELAARIDGKVEVGVGSEEEVEIRAATVQAVERLRKLMTEKEGEEEEGKGQHKREKIISVELDWWLWQEGEKLKDELPPHHRTLTVFY